MGRGLFPILMTLFLLVVVFGCWYIVRNNGYFIHPKAEDIDIHLNDSGRVLVFKCLHRDFGLRGVEHVYYQDSILNVSFYCGRYTNKEIKLPVDTSKVQQLKLYGQSWIIKDLRFSE